MLCPIGIYCVWLHLLPKLSHLLLVVVQLLSAVNINWLVWVKLRSLSSHLISLARIKIVFCKCLCLDKSFVYLYRILHARTLYLDFFVAKELIVRKNVHICVLVQLHALACLARKESGLSSWILCTCNILVAKRLAEFPLNF